VLAQSQGVFLLLRVLGDGGLRPPDERMGGQTSAQTVPFR
jgi:hypothetical protein